MVDFEECFYFFALTPWHQTRECTPLQNGNHKLLRHVGGGLLRTFGDEFKVVHNSKLGFHILSESNFVA